MCWCSFVIECVVSQTRPLLGQRFVVGRRHPSRPSCGGREDDGWLRGAPVQFKLRASRLRLGSRLSLELFAQISGDAVLPTGIVKTDGENPTGSLNFGIMLFLSSFRLRFQVSDIRAQTAGSSVRTRSNKQLEINIPHRSCIPTDVGGSLFYCQ